MKEELSLALDECISKITLGEWSLGDCKRAYPQHWDDLSGFLEVASAARANLEPPSLRKEFRAQSKARLLNLLKAQMEPTQKPEGSPWLSRPRLLRPAVVLISMLMVVVMLASGVGVVNASADSIPGDGLYPIKRTFEEIQLVLETSPEAEQALLLEFADERLAEMENALQAGRAQDANQALEGYTAMVERILGISAGLGLESESDGLVQARSRLADHQAHLEGVLERAPESAKEGLSNAIKRSQHAAEVLQKVQEGESPSELAPGQIKKASEVPSDEAIESTESPAQIKTPKPKDQDKDRTPGPPPWVTQGPKKNQ